MVKYTVLIFAVYTLFVIKGAIMLDPDFGEHIRMGQIILSQGIPKTDQFSYTMSNYPHIYHEWFIGSVIAWFYPFLDMWGLSAIFAIFPTLALVISIPKKPFKFFLGPLLLSASILLVYSGIRPQVISWFFLAILLKVIFDEKLWEKTRFFVPVLFLVWTNLHGSFGLGIIILFISFLIQSWERKKIDTLGFLVCLISFIATFINPYGKGLWYEFWQTSSDSSLRWYIQEWKIMLLQFDFAYFFLVALSTSLIIRYREKFTLQQVFLFFIFLFAGFLSVRNIPLWIIVSLPITITGIKNFHEEASKNKFSLMRFNRVYKIFLLSSVLIFIGQSYQIFKQLNLYSEELSYPKKAVVFLKTQQFNHIFNLYDWGGYLDWKMPEKKVFIDGRMPSWRWKAPNSLESDYIFKEYLKVSGGQDIQKIFDKYKVDIVLWPTQAETDPKTKPKNWFEKIQYDLLKKIPEENIGGKTFIEQLKSMGWKEVYKDDVAVIYKKP